MLDEMSWMEDDESGSRHGGGGGGSLYNPGHRKTR